MDSVDGLPPFGRVAREGWFRGVMAGKLAFGRRQPLRQSRSDSVEPTAAAAARVWHFGREFYAGPHGARVVRRDGRRFLARLAGD